MKILTERRCVIGEGPIWNKENQTLYFSDGREKAVCGYNLRTGDFSVRHLSVAPVAIAFDAKNKMILSCREGVFRVEPDGTVSPISAIKYCNDMKVGPDGAIYVGTQSSVRLGLSGETDGKLYRIGEHGDVRVLLDGLILSNGMEWSTDETKFYHTDSDTHIIKEYEFDRECGSVEFTGRQVFVKGVDGFTTDENDRIFAACWGQKHIAVIDTESMRITELIPTHGKIPTSCCFCGKNSDTLAVTTASCGADLNEDVNAGFTELIDVGARGRNPYIFGERLK